VEAVGRLGDDQAAGAVEDLGGDLLAAVGRQAVQEDHVGPRAASSASSTRNGSKAARRNLGLASWPMLAQSSE
jgi:hypothetical protein